MGLVKKVNQKNWREIHKERKKRKEEKFLKRALKTEKPKNDEESTATEEVNSDFDDIRTCSIAVPGSILANAQSPELRAYLAGQVARAACIYKISEIVIFDDICGTPPSVIETDTVSGNKKFCIQFARLLQYLECPQYLRKHFFPIHYDLKFAGLMNPLDAPHHLRQDEDFMFREGITTDKPVKKGKGTYVNIGLLKEALIEDALKPGLRVTVEITTKDRLNSKKICGRAVPPDRPVKQLKTYWGYSVRLAGSLSEVFSKSPFPKGYDLTIGTSERGTDIDSVKKKHFSDFKHAIIVFGGLQGLESALESDSLEVDDVSLLFDHYLNTCPQQGSRTIRTEEAILITLAELRKKCLFL
ncbi:UNVERIFIED_CONTAM: hypothetical protein PYX00_005515 [Menopon gallinae]|uniref:RNA methyltransferase n=1 Tax=Menopon gallinae TaxID=328185 RepID=A0AAW2HSI2_9NEOP